MGKTMIATRIDDGLLKQFDAWAAGLGLPRTKAMERAMRIAVNGRSEPAPKTAATRRIMGYHPISNEPIFEGQL